VIPSLSLDLFLELYRRFGDDLKRVRQHQQQFYSQRSRPEWLEQNVAWRTGRYVTRRLHLPLRAFMSLCPQLDDVEAEVTYLLVRQFRPCSIVEISPMAGWSSSWLLHALRDNGAGTLHSFDVIDDSVRLLPSDLTHGRWEFIRGDVRRTLDRLPRQIDYLFMDSDHSEQFARWYVDKILTRLQPGALVSVHDVFHTSDPCGHNKEGGIIVEWLAQHRKEFFTASPAKEPSHHRVVNDMRRLLGLGDLIHHSQTNSMLFFVA